MIKCFHWNLVSEHLIEIFSRASKDWKVVLQNDGNGIKFVDKNGVERVQGTCAGKQSKFTKHRKY
jgi:hypothetical protein